MTRLARLAKGALVRDSALNVAGHVLPLLAAVFTFPHLIELLGTDRFGALSLAWTLTGYANVFDFGLGRALTLMASRHLGRGERDEVGRTTWTALSMSLAFGLLATLAMHLAAAPVVDGVLGLEGEVREETLGSLRLIAYFLPVVILVTGVRGLLEAYRLFGVSNLIRTPMGALNYVAPLLIALRTARLETVVLAVVLVRCLEVALYLIAALRLIPDVTLRARVSWRRFRELVSIGGWMTVSNVIAPIMLNFDRFFIASMTSLTQVTYYVTPHTLVTRLRVIPTAIMGVLFPSFSRFDDADLDAARRLYLSSLRALGLLMAPVALLILVFAKPGLTLWVGPEISERSAQVAQYLGLGVLVHSLGQTPFTLLQARGRAATTALVHVLEVPLYVGYLYLLIKAMGIEGAGLAWLIRVTLSTLVLLLLAERLFARPHDTAAVPAPDR